MEHVEKIFTQETPAKIMGLLGATLFSMFLLFAVSVSNASFHSVEKPLPDPFGPSVVVSAIDNFAASYSRAVNGLAAPATSAVAVHVEGIKWVMAEASEPMVKALGLEGLAQPAEPKAGRVAGAFKVSAKEAKSSLTVDSLYSLILGR